MRRRSLLVSVAAGTALAGCTSSAPTETPTPDRYRSRFERNIDTVPDPSISRSNGVVTLTYSVDEPTEETIREDTRSVAIAWAQVIGAGWDADRIEVKVRSGDTVVTTYRIEARWAEQFNDKEITGGEYGAKIESTVETATPRPE